jgi:hypothetical protein
MKAIGLRRQTSKRMGMVAIILGLAGSAAIGGAVVDRTDDQRDAPKSQLVGAPGENVSPYVMRSVDDFDWTLAIPPSQHPYVMRAQDDIDWQSVATAEPTYVMRAQDDIAWPPQPVSTATPYFMVAEDDIVWPPVR